MKYLTVSENRRLVLLYNAHKALKSQPVTSTLRTVNRCTGKKHRHSHYLSKHKRGCTIKDEFQTANFL